MAAQSSDSETAVLRPRDVADLREIVAGHARALEPVGGGTKRAIGRPVVADRLELAAFAGITSYEPAELVLTAGAATALATIEQALVASSQRLAFEPPDFGALLGVSGEQTLGGVLAANLAGSRRVSAGAARDHFLGCTAVAGAGELFRAGGRVVKNVTGYDLPKVLAGSWGTLAVLTEATMRVVPAPETERTLLVPAATAAAAVAVLTAGLGSPHDVSAAAFDPARGALLRVEGFAASVAARCAALRALFANADDALTGPQSSALWKEIGSAVPLADCAVVWRLSVPPSDAAVVLERLAPERYLLDWGGGLIWAGYGSVDAARVRSAATAGHATLWKAPIAERAVVPVFQPQPPVLAEVAARLKRAFDPRGKLCPGRMG